MSTESCLSLGSSSESSEVGNGSFAGLHGCFSKLVGALAIRALVFGSDFWKLSYRNAGEPTERMVLVVHGDLHHRSIGVQNWSPVFGWGLMGARSGMCLIPVEFFLLAPICI